jgi:phosphoglucosamine mutase
MSAVAHAESVLRDSGRVLLRPSGVEQSIRVMVEAATREHADSIANRPAGMVAEV